jgi:serine/threonine protein kinase
MSRGAEPDDRAAQKSAPAGAEPVLHTPITSSDPTITAPGAAPVPDPTAIIGTPAADLPDFELLSELGRGGMGIVYKARQKSLDRIVAIKMLLSGHIKNERAVARFLAEARAAAGLDHPNIVGIYQVGECPLGHFFAMEYIDGQTLQQVLDKQAAGKHLSVSSAVRLMIPIAEAVGFAHEKGIIHRDLKPGNIMIDKFKRSVVMDFGIAKVKGKEGNLTGLGDIIGTPAYMPPEQTGEGIGEVGLHSDVYSLGAILYRLLTGQPAYEAENALKTILKVLSPDMPTPIRQLRPEVSLELSLICMKCLNKNPTDRYADANVLARELRGFRSSQPASGSGVRATVPPVVLVCQKTGKTIPLSGISSIIGRASDCEVVVKSPEVSKRHCRILVRDDEVSVEDLASVNGTIVNDRTVGSALLKDGDILEVGDSRFTVRIARKPH